MTKPTPRFAAARRAARNTAAIVAVAISCTVAPWGTIASSCRVDLSAPAQGDRVVRVATYNIENFASGPGQPQFEAAAAVLRRIGADVVCVNEIISPSAFAALATAAGYPHHDLAENTLALDTTHRSGVLSKWPFTLRRLDTSQTLSGDAAARDIMRNFLTAEVAVPDTPATVVFMVNHWQTGSSEPNSFVRSVEGLRAMQVTDRYDSRLRSYFLMGDMNDRIHDPPDQPPWFFEQPPGVPIGFRLGNDMVLPIQNGVFYPLWTGHGPQNLAVVEARQMDGSDATHAVGRLDYIWHSDAVSIQGSEVYDSADDTGGGLPKFGDPLPSQTSATASDHLPVFADVAVPVTIMVDVTVAAGTRLSGGVGELAQSDNARFRVGSQFGFTASEPNVVDLRVGAVTTVQDPQLIDLSVEGRLNQNGGTSKLRLRNWATNSFQQVHQYSIGSAEMIELVQGIDAANRVRASDGRIELSIRQSVIVTFTASGFVSSTDQVAVGLR